MSEQKPVKRVAIVGTAESWRSAPFTDPSIEIWSLNDAYCLGLPRVDRWFELHPIDKMVFRKPSQKQIRKEDVPEGWFIRPAGHIEWLKKLAQTNPVYLQAEPDASWPVNAKRFPIETVESKFGTYWASGPSYMVALAILEGFTEIHVYGIHLATEQEYREQRPNFEMLLGIARGLGITVVMADRSPVLKHPWRYAYEDKPQAAESPFAAEWKAVQQEKKQLTKALIAWPAGKDKSRALARLQRLEIIELDIRQQAMKRATGGTLAITVAA
jgi:hypothetical protein